MKAVVAGTKALKGRSAERARAALARLAKAPEPFDDAEARARFASAFDGRWSA
jgi:beta-N-acetylhexosaminidase